MSYIGKKPPFITIPDDDSVTSAMIVDGTITSTDMAVDPRNASNLNSGDVPLAQLDNVDTSGIVANKDDIALLGFKVAANGSLARYNLVDQSIDAFEDASGIDASTSTNEIRNASGNYYSGSSTASGGSETTHGSYTVNSFLSSGTFTVGAAGNIDLLVVGGGGAGGGGSAGSSGHGGGGAGAIRTATSQAVIAQSYTVTVGSGGAAVIGADTGTVGGDSSFAGSGFSTITSNGGGGGEGGTGNSVNTGNGSSGGSGYNSGSTGAAGGTYGNKGGDGQWSTGASNKPWSAPGGGGSGSVGGNPSDDAAGGAGGTGTANDYRTGSNVYYSAGGGGGGGIDFGVNTGGTGGSSVGGNGTSWNSGTVTAATDGAANSGSGGGGGGGDNDGVASGDGGSGIVVIRYTTGALGAPMDMTLISNSQTAQSAPTTGDLVITYTDGAGTATVNTDIKAYISRDGSAYTSAVTLASQGTTGGHTILTANGVDLSGITSGTSMKWKIETLNQSVSKDTRIHAVSLGWS